jgi:hypothetical protein
VTDARARYNAMTVRFDKRIRNNWGVNANYTFSRLMDNQFGESNTYSSRNAAALDNYNLDAEWGYSLLDVPHRVNINGTLVVPVGEGHKWLSDGLGNALLGGWSIHGRVALPERLPGQRLAVEQQLGTPRQLAAAEHRAGRCGRHERIARGAPDELDQRGGVHAGAGLHLRQRAAHDGGPAHAGAAQRRPQRAEGTEVRG